MMSEPNCEAAAIPRPNRGPVTAAIGVALSLLCFVIYLKTLCPTTYVGDSGEVASVAWLLDVAHPTGYPFYSMLARTFALMMPIGSVVFRMNLFSAVCTVVSLFLLFRLMSLLGIPAGISATAAGVLGLSLTLWSQSLISEVYALHITLISAVLLLMVLAHRRGEARYLYLAWFLVGLSFGNHVGTVLAMPLVVLGTVVLLKTNFRSFKLVLPMVLLCVLGASIYVYLPVRATIAGLPGNWGDPRTLDRFMFHVMGKQFKGLMFSQSVTEVLGNLRDYFGGLLHEFSPFGVAAAAAGAVILLLKKKAAAALLCLLWLPFVFWGVNYDVADVEVFFLPSHIAICFLLAAAVWALMCIKRGLGQRNVLVGLVVAASAVLLTASLILNYHPNDRSNHTLGYDYATMMLDTPCRGATVYTFGWSSPFVLRYLNSVEGLRPDIDVRINWDVGSLTERGIGLSKSGRVYYEFPSQLDDAPSRMLAPEGVLFHIAKKANSGRAGLTPLNLTRARAASIDRQDVAYDWLSLAVLSKVNYMIGASEALLDNNIAARERLKAAEALATDNAGVLNNIGNIYLRAGWFSDALRMFEAAHEADPTLGVVAVNIPLCYLKTGRYEAVLESYEALGGLDFGYPYIHVLAGDAYSKLGKPEAAKREYLRAIELAPHLASAFNNLGTVYDELGQTEDAVEAYKRAVEIDPEFASPYNNLATIALRQGWLEQADALARKAIELEPKLGEAYNTLGNVRIMAGKYDEAKALYLEAIHNGAFEASVVNNLAVASMKLGELQRSYALLQAALSLDPGFDKAVQNLAIVGSLLGLESGE